MLTQLPQTQEPALPHEITVPVRPPDPRQSLRIVHIVSSLKVGGMEHFVLRLASAQQRQGHTVSVLALQGGPLAEEARTLGLGVSILGGQRKLPRVLRGALTLRRLRPDIAHAHNQTSLHYAALAKRVCRARVVMTNHGQGQGSPRTPSAQEWHATDSVVAVSQAVADRMTEGQPNGALLEKISLIRNGVELGGGNRTRQEMRDSLGLSEAASLVGIIAARIDHLKGHDCLLRALARLQESRVPVTLLIAGDGPQRTAMEALAQDLGLGPDRIRFLGFRSDVRDLLGASDFFVLPSLTEGLPLSMLEAMAQGLPVIATPVGGIPELVDDTQQGLLVPVDDPEALAGAMATLAWDPALRQRLGTAGYARVSQDFSFGGMIQSYDALYQTLCPAELEGRS